MAKISELADGGNLLNDDELIVLRAGGNVRATVGNLPTVDASGNQSFADNAKATFGAGSDLQIYHTGTNSILKNLTGELLLQGNGITLRGNSPTETMLTGDVNGAITLHYDSSAKLATTSTGVDVTGTVVADSLTVDGSILAQNTTGYATATLKADTNNTGSGGTPELRFELGGTQKARLRVDTSDNVEIATGTGVGSTRFGIASNGDVSFYEDTGATAKFFWDASGEVLGLGTTSPSATYGLDMSKNIRVKGSAPQLELEETDTSNQRWAMFGLGGDLTFRDITNNVYAMTLESSTGNVGIGTNSPIAPLHVNSGAYDVAAMFESSDSAARIQLKDNTSASSNTISVEGDAMYFFTNGARALHIDDSQNVGIGSATPNYKLDVEGSGSLLRVNATSGNSIAQFSVADTVSITGVNFGDSGSTTSGQIWYRHNGDSMAFSTAGSEAMRIDSAGKLGVNITTPTSMLHVKGDTSAVADTVAQFGNGTNSNSLQVITSDGNLEWGFNALNSRNLVFQTNQTERMRIDSAGNVGIGTNTPDQLLDVSSNSAPTIRISNTRNDANWDVDPVFGALEFHSADGSGSGASVRASVKAEAASAFGNATDFVIRNGDSSGVQQENARITYQGRLGLGTDAPASQLHLRSGSGNHALFESTSGTSSYINFVDTSSSGNFNVGIGSKGDNLVFKTSGIETARISAGKLGIGTESPNAPLHAYSSTSDTVATFESGDPSVAVNFVASDNSMQIATSSTDGIIKNDGAGSFRLFNNGSERMRIASNGNVGVGTIAPSYKFTVREGSTDVGIVPDGVNGSYIRSGGTEANSAVLRFLRTGNVESMRIDSSGNLGIGTSSPAFSAGSGLRIERDSTATLRLQDTGAHGFEIRASASAAEFVTANSKPFTFGDSSSEHMRIDSAGNVGIGTQSPDKALVVRGVDAEIVIDDTDTTDTPTLRFRESGSTSGSISTSSSDMRFTTGSTERMRIDSTGNLLVGKTAQTISTVGVEARYNGLLFATADGADPLKLNRLTSEGAIADFRKDGTTIGSIGVNDSDLYIGTGDTTLRFADAVDAVVPRGTSGAARDGDISLGIADNRFKDLYLAGGAYLGGTAAANKLDDYEEGTWSPVYSTTGTDFTTVTMDVLEATYTKIGDTVVVRAYIRTDDVDTTGASGSVVVTGLPFTAAATAPVCVGLAQSFDTNGHPSGGYISSGTTSVFLQEKASSDGASGSLDVGDLQNGTVANANIITFSATYRTTA